MLKKLIIMKSYPFRYYIALTLSLFVVATSCNKDFDKVVTDPGDGSTLHYKKPKVLYLIVDGARGSSVRDAKTANITSLIAHSIYSWNSVSDTSKNDATN